MKYKFLLSLLGLGTLLFAEEIPQETIVCEPTLIYACSPEKDRCEQVEVVNIDGVQYFEIDTKKNTLIGKIGEAQVDIENIISRHGNENTFIFFGTHADSKFDWVLRIDKKSKKMILLATNENLDGFTVYGTCRWEEGK
ncbi:hypothetical protein [Sulfurovum riftiae]|uniref:Uncharacterized protein n=1 Tax=Sulfurovum riftiae TaxID=1630136 RepID=A0A151CHN7_9BACT|nr:hypothetical protein [Sulfurovum riftiae]KYJ86773.1 hypothetical protein AS592_08070 [Sulfurovum riftiae]